MATLISLNSEKGKLLWQQASLSTNYLISIRRQPRTKP